MEVEYQFTYKNLIYFHKLFQHYLMAFLNNIYYISNDEKYSINNSNEHILINYGNNINKVYLLTINQLILIRSA